MASGRSEFPQAARDWLVAGTNRDAPVLTLSATPKIPQLLAATGLDVVVAVHDREEAARFGNAPAIRTVIARAEALPFATHSIATVIAYQALHRFAPGLAMPEIARVLALKGQLAVCYFSRDDSVPWVQRLTTLMRQVSPDAMSSDDSAQHLALTTSKYFVDAQNRDFRVWVPISRTQMVAMVASQPEVDALVTSERDQVLDAAGGIFDSAASGGDLRLPYKLRCWRATVDHAEFTRPVRLADDGLIIPI